MNPHFVCNWSYDMMREQEIISIIFKIKWPNNSGAKSSVEMNRKGLCEI